jgi:hypothetical protein
MVRSIVAVLLGLLVANLVITVVQRTGHAVYPPPAGLDFNDREAVRKALAEAPTGALLFVLLSYAAGALAGGALTAWMARRAPLVHALVVGAFLTAAGVASVVMIPHPLWLTVAVIGIFLPAAYAGALLVKRFAGTKPQPA